MNLRKVYGQQKYVVTKYEAGLGAKNKVNLFKDNKKMENYKRRRAEKVYTRTKMDEIYDAAFLED